MCIIKKEGENSGKLYDYIAQNICKYFIYNKGNKKIINYKNNNLNVSNNNNNMYENKLIKEKNILENVNNNFKSIYGIKNNYSVPLNNYKLKFIVTKNK